MDPSDTERPVVTVSVSSAPASAPEVREKPAEGPVPSAEPEPPHESGYGFGV
jgi:hypothetical protein